MSTVFGADMGRRARAGQDETSPIPLEVMISRALGRMSQDETSPFPLDFVVIAGQRRDGRDETLPFPLEYQVALPEVNGPAPRAPRRQGTRGKALPRQKPRAVEASRELRAYAARLARGEALPPYRGPVLASEQPGESLPAAPPPCAPRGSTSREASPRERGRVEPVPPVEPAGARRSQGMAAAKLALGLLLLTGALVAAAVGGDDAQLRAAGDSIHRWFTGGDSSFQSFPPLDPAARPCSASADEREPTE